MGKYLWMAVTADELELPLAVADTAEELGKIYGVSNNTIISSISRGHNGRQNGWKYVKVPNRND